MSAHCIKSKPTLITILVVVLGLPGSAFAAQIAEYTFNNGDAGNATVFGASLTADRFQNPARAFFFDGNDYIQTPVGSNATPLAVSVWFRADTVGGERSIVDSDVGGSFGHSLIIDYGLAQPSTGNLDVQFHNGATDTGNDGLISSGEWNHAVVCWGSNVEVYLNTALVYSQAYSPPGLDGTNFRLGRHNSSDPQYFHGAIDDVRFYDACLSQSEVNGLFDEANSVRAIPSLPAWGLVLLASLIGSVAFYRLKA